MSAPIRSLLASAGWTMLRLLLTVAPIAGADPGRGGCPIRDLRADAPGGAG